MTGHHSAGRIPGPAGGAVPAETAWFWTEGHQSAERAADADLAAVRAARAHSTGVKYRRSASFDHDFSRLPVEHRRLFLRVLREYFLPGIAAGAFTDSARWPTRLRIHRLTDSDIYSVTWNFSSPDGRATFHLEHAEDDDPLLVWRRIGDHSIYQRP